VALELNEVTRNMLSMLKRLIGEQIRLEIDLSPEPCAIKADGGQLGQVLMNLVVNARDAISGTGRVTIETGDVYIDASQGKGHADCSPGEYVMLSVTDDGCGMDAATLENIFEPFFTTKVVGKGTGLGLSTVYGIVKQNDGLIEVCSEPGQGTTFRIYLPRVSDLRVGS
jgi:signal transduction histidine kinase